METRDFLVANSELETGELTADRPNEYADDTFAHFQMIV